MNHLKQNGFLINIELWSTGLSVLAIFLGVVFINDRPSTYEYYVAVIGLSRNIISLYIFGCSLVD